MPARTSFFKADKCFKIDGNIVKELLERSREIKVRNVWEVSMCLYIRGRESEVAPDGGWGGRSIWWSVRDAVLSVGG